MCYLISGPGVMDLVAILGGGGIGGMHSFGTPLSTPLPVVGVSLILVILF